MDRTKCRLVSDAALKALKTIEEQFKVKVSPARGSFSNSNCVLKFEFAEMSSDGQAMTRKADNWRYAEMMGLPKDGIGKEFKFRGRTYKVTGFRPRAKYSIIAARQPDGKDFCFQPRQAFRDYSEGWRPLSSAGGFQDEDSTEAAIAATEGQD